MNHPKPICAECGKEFDAGASPGSDRCPSCVTADEVANPSGGPSVYVEDAHESKPDEPYDPNPDDLEPGDYEEQTE